MAAWVVMTLLCLVHAAQADVFRPAYLELRELGEGRYDVLWKVPALGNRRLAGEVRFPEGTTRLSEPVGVFADSAYAERWSIVRGGGLAGQKVVIGGMPPGVTDVIVRIERADGGSQVERLAPAHLEFSVKGPSSRGAVSRSYLLLGIGHILHGADHLLFVLALLLVVKGARRIVATITAFTLAHSITLALAALGWVVLPGPPVEATVALSIAFVAAEIVSGMRGHPGVTTRAPWVVAFAFGLLHGLGFASALAQIGLPHDAVALALLMFNVGVEAGQLLFIALLLPLIAMVSRAASKVPVWMRFVPPYAIGTVAMFWVVERVGAF